MVSLTLAHLSINIMGFPSILLQIGIINIHSDYNLTIYKLNVPRPHSDDESFSINLCFAYRLQVQVHCIVNEMNKSE